MTDILRFEFMRNALLAALLASLACGVIGAYVVVKRVSYISGGIAHAAFGGIGLAYFLGISPVLGVVPFALAAALCIGLITRKTRLAEDTAIGMLWATGMALGVLFIGLTRGYTPDLFSILFGNILTVPASDIAFMAWLDVLIVLCVFFLYKQFLVVCFDEEYARVAGIKTTLVYLLLLSLIALTVVILIRIVGIVLVIALLTIPAAIARQFVTRLLPLMALAVALSVLLTTAGLWLSYLLDIASGATIILLSALAFVIASVIRGRANKGHPTSA